MKFKAEEIDLELELVTLSSTEQKLSPKTPVSAEKSIEIIEQWIDIEAKSSNTISTIGEQLAVVYSKDSNWWLKNFDPKTLSDIVSYVAKALGGIRKNDESSN